MMKAAAMGLARQDLLCFCLDAGGAGCVEWRQWM
jgi:hypothetical protein